MPSRHPETIATDSQKTNWDFLSLKAGQPRKSLRRQQSARRALRRLTNPLRKPCRRRRRNHLLSNNRLRLLRL
jgi:hypothetical protein